MATTAPPLPQPPQTPPPQPQPQPQPMLATYFADAHEALLGIPRDVLGNSARPKTLYQIFTEGDRLRGLGTAMVLVALVGAVFGLFED